MNEIRQKREGISRVGRSRASAQANYDRMSAWYGRLAGLWESRPREVGLRHLGVRAGERVVEIGFGSGHALPLLAREAGEKGHVCGVDLSLRMCRVAQERIAPLGLAQRVGLVQGDALRLPLRARACDAILVSFTLELFDTPQIPLVLAECRRILRRGGRICVVALSKEGAQGWATRAYEWGHRKWPTVLDCRPIYVGRAAEDAGFSVSLADSVSMAGLAVAVVLARKAG